MGKGWVDTEICDLGIFMSRLKKKKEEEEMVFRSESYTVCLPDLILIRSSTCCWLFMDSVILILCFAVPTIDG